MTAEQVISEIASLPVAERIRVIQAIWDGLPQDAEIAMSPGQKDELDRRWASFQEDPASALTEEEFRRQIREARK